MDRYKCECCGSPIRIVCAPMLPPHKNKWVIYRKNGLEVTFEIHDHLIRKASLPIRDYEKEFIRTHLIKEI